MSGYTKKQAERIKHKIELDMAKIEDRALTMASRVTDHTLKADIDSRLEEMREVAYALEAIVDRRTRP